MLQNNYNQNNPLFKGFIIKNFILNSNNEYEVYLEVPRKESICPHCGNTTNIIKDYRIQRVKDLDLAGTSLTVTLRKRRYICRHCHKSFTENNPLIKRYQHFTSRFYNYIFKELQSMQSFKHIAKKFSVSVTSVVRWFDNISYPKAPVLPEIFSIDEFKGNANNEKFQCNISDPVNHRIIDILPSRKQEDLCTYFRLNYSLTERCRIKTVVMDLSSLFKSTITLLFPNAEIVADKFHVTRLVNWSMEAVRKRIQKKFFKERRKWFKRSKNILLKANSKLSIEDSLVLNRMLAADSELEKAYILKERFKEIFYFKTEEAAKQALSDWLMLAADLAIPEFKHCITTFTKWSKEIINTVKYRVSNGFIEGSNNKIKVLKRISYGVQNFERFRNRILYLCS